MTKQRVANIMLEDVPWDGTELAAPLTLPGALLAPTYVEQKLIAKPANPPAGSLRLYPKADGKYYQLDATGTESVISGMSQVQSDGRYLQLAGGTLTGPLTATSIFAQNYYGSGDVSAGGNIVAGTSLRFGQATDPEFLYKEMPGRLRLAGAQLTIDSNLNVGSYTQLAEVAMPVTPGAGQLRMYAKADHKLYIRDTTGVETDLTFQGITQAVTDSLYPRKTDVDPYPQYLTPAEGDARYALVPGGPSGGYLTQTTADSLYPRKTDVDPYPQYLTPAEGSVLYAPIVGGGYLTQTQADTRYLQLTGGAISGALSVSNTLLVSNILTLGTNLNFTGGAARILADFSNASLSARASFQSSVANGASEVQILPNGSSDGAWIEMYNAANPTNSGGAYLGLNAGAAYVGVGKYGTGIQLPLVFSVGTERMRIATSGLVTMAAGLTVNNDIRSTAGSFMLSNGGAFYVKDSGGTDRLLQSFGGEQLHWAATGGGFRWVNQNNSVQWMGLDTAGGLTVTGAIVAGGGVSVGNGLTVTNHTMISQATGGIASTGGSEGQLELQNAGSGASKIAFHRTGAYAAYFGIDTDNVWRVGGWSMGAVAYRVLLGDNFNNGGPITIAGQSNLHYISCEGLDVGVGPIYFAHNGSYYLQLSSNILQVTNMNLLSWGWVGFNGNSAINWSYNGNIVSTHQVAAPNFVVTGSGTYNFGDTNVRISRPANIMYFYAYDAQWAFIRTTDSANCGYVDGSGFHSLSKEKYKTSITPIRDGLKLVCDQRVTPVSYSVMGVNEPDIPSMGFTAEAMAKVVPDAVGYDDEGPASINYGSLVAVLWDAVRTLNSRIEVLEKTA